MSSSASSGTNIDDTGVVVFRQRRNLELALVLLACALGVGGYALSHGNLYAHLPDNIMVVGPAWFAIGVIAHLVVRWRAPYADPVILPSVLVLNGIGLAMIDRIDRGWIEPTSAARNQFIWTMLAVAIFIAALVIVRDYRVLQRFPYLLFLAGLSLLLLPMVPGLGVEKFGSRIWIEVAGYSFQPAEVAKIVLTLAFASYLASRREVLQLAGKSIGRFTLPRLSDLVPIAIMWAASVLVLIYQRDLGTSLLFFGLFVMMMYVSTEQVRWVVLGVVAFFGAAGVVATQASHVQRRFSGWLDPFSDFDANYQIIEGQFGMAWGGLFGRGWGLGRPGLTPLANSDFIAASIGEELGVLGLVAVVLLYFIIVMRGLRAALSARDPFGKLLVAGLSFTVALQVFAIIGGVIRLAPLTGLTTPFMSQGGSSMLANWLIVAIVLHISHEARRPVAPLVASSDVADFSDDKTSVIEAGGAS